MIFNFKMTNFENCVILERFNLVSLKGNYAKQKEVK